MVSRGYLVLSALLVAGCVQVVGAGSGSAAAPRYGPIQENWPGPWRRFSDPGVLPQGMNTGCGGNSGRERPVVLLNGAFQQVRDLKGRSEARGGRILRLRTGLRHPHRRPFHQMGDLRRSAAEIGRFIDTVKARTRAERWMSSGTPKAGWCRSISSMNSAVTTISTFVAVASPMRGMSFYGMLRWLCGVPGGRALMNATVPAAADGVRTRVTCGIARNS